MSDITEQGPAWSLVDLEVGVPSGGTLNWITPFYARTVTVDPQITTLQFEGNDTSQTVDEVTRIDITLLFDKHDPDAIQAIYGKEKLTGIEDADWGMWMGDDAEAAGVTAALRYTVKFKDESVSPHEQTYIRYFWPLGTAKLIRPQTAEWKAKHVYQLNMSFEKTTVDAAGQALDDVPATGAYYRYEKLTPA